MSLIDEMIQKREQLMPKTGFNLVGYDDFEIPPDGMFLIAHYEDISEAKKALKEYKGKAYILESK